MRRLALIALVIIFVPAPAFAHGTMVNPISRAYTCYQENPESPRSDVCKAVVALGGTQPLYDWNEVNIANAAGNHRSLIPDGKLCSAGRDKYRGLDLARSDWPVTNVAAGPYTFRFIGTAPHRGTFELYMTRDGFNPTQPLRWSDLESTPFLRVADPALVNGVYQLPGQLPAKTGRHLIYTIWQRSDSPEAFYTCSDVAFGAVSHPAPSTVPPPPSACPPSPAAHCPASPPAAEPAPATSSPAPDALPAADVLPQTGGIGWRYPTYGGVLLALGLALAWFARDRWLGKHRAH